MERAEKILQIILERARWKKEFEKHDIDIPRAKHPEIELTSSKKGRTFGTRGARPDPTGRQAAAEWGRRSGRNADSVYQTGSPGDKGEDQERKAQIKRSLRRGTGNAISTEITYGRQGSKAAKRARAREMDPGRGLRTVARAATRKGLRKRSKSGWEWKGKR